MPHQDAIVRIVNHDGTEVGAGFVAEQKYIFTCAHVVRDALKLRGEIDRETAKGKAVKFYILFDEEKREHVATVSQVYPGRQRNRDDVAVLRINEVLPIVPRLDLLPGFLKDFYRNHTAEIFAPEEGEQVISPQMQGLNGTGRLQIEMDARKGWSGLPVFVEGRENLVAGMIAQDIKNSQSRTSDRIVLAVAGHHLYDILREIEIEDAVAEGVKRKMEELDSQTQQQLNAAQGQAINFVQTIWDNARKLKVNGQAHLRKREVLVYGWLLQKTLGSIQRKDLYRCVDPDSMEQGGIPHFLGQLAHASYLEEDEHLYLRFGRLLMSAIESVGFSRTAGINPIPILGGLTDLQLLQYFAELEEPPQDFDIQIVRAFEQALKVKSLIPITDNGKKFYPIVEQKGDLLFYTVVDTYRGAYTLEKLNTIAAAALNVRGSNQSEIPVLLFAPNSVDVELYRNGGFRRGYHVWSLSAARLFGELSELAKRYDQDVLLQAFKANFFPESPHSDFSATDWLGRVKDALPD